LPEKRRSESRPPRSVDIRRPVEAFQVFPQMGDGPEPVQDERPLEPAADILYRAGHPGVPFHPTQAVIEHPDQFADILLPGLFFGNGPVEQVQKFNVEFQPEPVDDDVVGMQIAVGLVQQMDFFNPARQRVEQMERLKGVEPLPGKLFQKFRQQIPFHIIRNQYGDGHLPDQQNFFGVVLDQNGHLAELVEFAGISLGSFVAKISLWKKQFRRPLDPRADFLDLVHLAFPTGAQQGNDLIFPGYFSSRCEVKRIHQGISGAGGIQQ